MECVIWYSPYKITYIYYIGTDMNKCISLKYQDIITVPFYVIGNIANIFLRK